MKRPLDNCGYQPERNLRAYPGAPYLSPQPFEINEVVYTLLSHVDDQTTICHINNVSKKCHFVVEQFFQNGWFNVSSKNKPVIRDLSQFHEYATNKFDLKIIKKIYIKEDKTGLQDLRHFPNIEYLSLNNCPNFNIFPPFKFLKVLDLSFCGVIGGRPYVLKAYLSGCPSLEKLKLYKCNYDDDSLKSFLSDEKFSQKKFTLISHDGDKYKGFFKNGRYHGKGLLRLLSGITYEGDFKNDLYHGKGVYKSENGGIYKGDFENSKRHGKGVYKFVNGVILEGDFKNDLFHGKGFVKYLNGGIFEGEFENNLRHGPGRFTCPNGIISEGTFNNGVFVGEKKITLET